MQLAERLATLPIFPLPRVQMFPNAILPLHVFEPRYRALLADCLASDRLFAIAAIDPDSDGDGERPEVLPVCGVGEVIAHEPLADGRSNILLHGKLRVRILDELPQRGLYRVVRAEPLVDRYGDGLDLATALRSLVALADQLAARLPEGGDTLRALARSHDDAPSLCDVLGAAIVTDAGARQALLENVDVAARIDVVSTAIAEAVLRFDGPSNVN